MGRARGMELISVWQVKDVHMKSKRQTLVRLLTSGEKVE